MTIELSYANVFWIGFIVGVLILLLLQKIFNGVKFKPIKVGSSYRKPTYLKVEPLNYTPFGFQSNSKQQLETPENEKFDCKAR